jgi:hypothetical protein
MMSGNITRTAAGYILQMSVTKNADKMTMAAYSGDFSIAELDNRTGVRRASLDLLQKMGVALTPRAQGELARVAEENRVTAQNAISRGYIAQQQRTEVEALTYYFQAAAYDPSLKEAVNRSSILNANITSGNIGSDVRNDIQWRRDWVTRLTETEQYFDSFNRAESMPYTLFYTTGITQGAVNYQTETVALSIETHLHGSGIWTLSVERALQAVYDGLEATKRKDTWGLGSWPRQGVTSLNAFARRSGNFSVVFELLNNRNEVIGRQTLQTGGIWELNWSGRPVVNVNADERKTLAFQNVKANDITDRMTIRVATVNGIDAETAARNGVLQIRASTKDEFDRNDRFKYARGEIQGFANTRTPAVDIPNNIWGDPVIAIRERAFENNGLTRVVIPNSVTSIGNSAFANNQLASVSMPNSIVSTGANAFTGNRASVGEYEVLLADDGRSLTIVSYNRKVETLQIPSQIQGMPVTRIAAEAFKANRFLTSVTIPNSVITIGANAFDLYTSVTIRIGANVSIAEGSYLNDGYVSSYQMLINFSNYYDKNGKKAGTYKHSRNPLLELTTLGLVLGTWSYSP